METSEKILVLRMLLDYKNESELNGKDKSDKTYRKVCKLAIKLLEDIAQEVPVNDTTGNPSLGRRHDDP